MSRWIEILLTYLQIPVDVMNLGMRYVFEWAAKSLVWAWDFFSYQMPYQIAELIPQGLVDFLNRPIITELLDIIGDVFWFYPVIPVLGLYSSVYLTIFHIRLFRWIVGFIPTIEG